MLDQEGLVYGGTINPHGYDEFRAWAAAVRAAVVRAEVGDDSQKRARKTHADVKLPQLKENQVVKKPCVVE